VLVAALEDFLFICFVTQKGNTKNWRSHYRHLLLPSFFTSVTTFIGFDALSAGELDIIRRFGSWSAFAAMTEWLIVFMVLPALLQVFPKLRVYTNTEPSKWVKKLDHLKLFAIPRYVALFSLALYAVGIIGAKTLVVQDAPHKIFSPDHAFRQSMDYIKESRGWITEVSLVFKDAHDEIFNESAIAQIKSQSGVLGVEDPFEVKKFLKHDLDKSNGTLAANLYESSFFAKRLISDDRNTARAIVYLEDTDIMHINALRTKTQEICESNCYLAGTLVSYGEFGTRVLSSFLDSLSLSIILVLLLLTFIGLALEQKHTFKLVISSIWGPMILLSGFVIFKIPISYITSVFVSLLVGMAGDNAIHYMFENHHKNNSQAYRDLGGASMMMTICMIAISASLFISIFAPMKTLGLLLIIGFILGILGDFWILDALQKFNFNSFKKFKG
jgi:predicted RND superfamily exporter protein